MLRRRVLALPPSHRAPASAQTWLTIDPPYGLLAPGERATLTLTVTVDDAVARDISLGRELSMLPTSGSGTAAAAAAGGVLEDILILRMERGRDYFVAVSATVLPTAFGCSLAQLSRRPEPMRALALTAAATRELNRLNEVALGVSPTVTATSGTAGAAGAAVGAGVGPREPPNPSAGSHSLAHMLASDESDIAWTAGSPSIAAPLTLPSSDATKRGSALMGVPKEIWRLVDALVTRCGRSRCRSAHVACIACAYCEFSPALCRPALATAAASKPAASSSRPAMQLT